MSTLYNINVLCEESVSVTIFCDYLCLCHEQSCDKFICIIANRFEIYNFQWCFHIFFQDDKLFHYKCTHVNKIINKLKIYMQEMFWKLFSLYANNYHMSSIRNVLDRVTYFPRNGLKMNIQLQLYVDTFNVSISSCSTLSECWAISEAWVLMCRGGAQTSHDDFMTITDERWPPLRQWGTAEGIVTRLAVRVAFSLGFWAHANQN